MMRARPAKPLRIAVIAHALRVAGGLSVGRNIASTLSRLAPEHRYLFTIAPGVGYEAIVSSFPQAELSVCHHPAAGLRRLRYELRELPQVVRRFQPDVVLALGNRGFRRLNCPQAVLLHQSYLTYPCRHFGGNILDRVGVLPSVLARRWCLRRSLPATQVVFCQTEVAKDRIQAFYRYSGRIVVSPNAVSQWTFSTEEPSVPPVLAALAGRMKLFYLTRYYPHKNLEALIEVFRRYPSDLRNVVAIITIEPEQGPKAASLLRAVREHGLQEKVINVGELEQSELAGYFRHSDALLMPTLLESFSGTYLEAMHFGLPILTSDLDFAHAVCADAAAYFDPWDPSSIRDAILRIEADPMLRARLADKGSRRLKMIQRTWDDVVREMMEWVYRIVEEYRCASPVSISKAA